jgi:hypothetical protein
MRRCARGAIGLRVTGVDAGSVSTTTFSLNGTFTRRGGTGPFRLAASRLPRGSVARVGAEPVLGDGRSRRFVRHVRICGR